MAHWVNFWDEHLISIHLCFPNEPNGADKVSYYCSGAGREIAPSDDCWNSNPVSTPLQTPELLYPTPSTPYCQYILWITYQHWYIDYKVRGDIISCMEAHPNALKTLRRNQTIKRMKEAGSTFEEISKAFNITRQRAHQIYKTMI